MSVDSSAADRGGQKRSGQFVVNLLTALGVLLIGAGAIALSYPGIYERARETAPTDWMAPLYPGLFVLLLLLAFMSSYVLRAGRRWRRLAVDAIIALLVLLGFFFAVEDQLPVGLSEDGEAMTFAAAPWIASGGIWVATLAATEMTAAIEANL
jgi:hypothetical protein